MKQTIFTSQFCQYNYDGDTKLLEQVWINNSESMTTEDFKSTMLSYVGLYKQYDIEYLLVDSREMRYLVEPKVQRWVNEHIITVIMLHIKKLAFLLSNDIFEEVSIRQAMEEQESLPFETKYFADEQQAREWLM